MPLIIDCYNLLHQAMPPHLAGLDEDRLCRLLVRSPWQGQRIVVVCDGVVKPLGLIHSPVDEVDLVYSGAYRTADDVIVRLVDADTAPRRLTVVTSDREVQKAARRRRAQVIASEQFVHLLSSLAARSSSPGASIPDRPMIDPLPADQVTRWLKAFGLPAENSDDVP